MKISFVCALIISINCVLTTDAFSGENSISIFRFGNQTKRFINMPKRKITISENCGTRFEQMTCLAAQSIKLATLKGISKRQLASRNPGSVICTEVLQQKVVIGVDQHRNENSFCVFKDESLIDNGTLYYYANERR